MRQVFLSGRMVAESEARVSIFDAGFMLGDTVTESTRTFGHRPFKLEEHVQRLYKSLKVTRIDPGYTPEEMLRISREVLEANLPDVAPRDDCWLVHNISRGLSVAGSDPTLQSGDATVVIHTWPLDLRAWAPFYDAGCHAVTAMSRAQPAQSLDARIKNRSRMGYTLAEIEVKLVDPQAQGVILDIHGNVAENKGGNLFCVSDDVLRTPGGSNFLRGLSRETVLELADEMAIPCRQEDLQPYDLYTADEVFFTSTPYCIMPATRFNGLPVGNAQVGPVTRRLLEAWSSRVGLDIAQQARDQMERQ
jgi:branched-chain amino acid aminotransferase